MAFNFGDNPLFTSIFGSKNQPPRLPGSSPIINVGPQQNQQASGMVFPVSDQGMSVIQKSNQKSQTPTESNVFPVTQQGLGVIQKDIQKKTPQPNTIAGLLSSFQTRTAATPTPAENIKLGIGLKLNVQKGLTKLTPDVKNAIAQGTQELQGQTLGTLNMESGAVNEVGTRILKAIEDKIPVGNIRLDKFNIPTESKVELGKLIEDNSGFLTQRRGVQSIQDTMKLAESIFPNTRLKAGTALNAEELQSLGNTVGALQTKVTQLSDTIAKGDNSDTALLGLAAAKSELAFALESFAGATSESGRALRQLRELRNAIGSGDAGLIRRAVDLSGGRANTEEVAKKLVDFGDDTLGKINYIRSLNKPGLAKKVNEVWINSILSSPTSQLANIIGNSAGALLNPVIKAGQAAVELGNPAGRQVYFREVPEEIFGLAQGVGDGVKKAAYVFKNGITVDQASKLDIGNVPSIGGKIGDVVRTPTRLLSAADEFFKTMVGTSQIRTLAYRTARNEGLKGEKLYQRTAELINNPTPEIMKGVDYRKLDTTYQTDLGKLGEAAMKFRNTEIGVGNLKMQPFSYLVPFIKTPINIAKRAGRLSPLGLVDILAKVGTGGFKSLPANEASRRLAETAIGSAFGAYIMQKTLEGKITGSAPTDPQGKSTFYDVEGKQPYSIKIGNDWVSYGRIEPFATIIGSVADITKTSSQEDATKAAQSAILTIGKNLKDKTFLSGISGFIDGLDDPTKARNWVNSFATSLVPAGGLLRYARTNLDASIRKPDTLTEKFKNVIPGLSTQVPVMRDVFGETIKKTRSQSLSPISSTSAEPRDTTLSELRTNNIQISPWPASVGGKKLSNKEYSQFNAVAGKLFKKGLDGIVNTPEWKNASQYDKQNIVDQLKNTVSKTTQEVIFPTKIMYNQIKSELLKRGFNEQQAAKETDKVLQQLQDKINTGK